MSLPDSELCKRREVASVVALMRRGVFCVSAGGAVGVSVVVGYGELGDSQVASVRDGRLAVTSGAPGGNFRGGQEYNAAADTQVGCDVGAAR